MDRDEVVGGCDRLKSRRPGHFSKALFQIGTQSDRCGAVTTGYRYDFFSSLNIGVTNIFKRSGMYKNRNNKFKVYPA